MKTCTKEEKAAIKKLLTTELNNASGIKAIGHAIKGRGGMAVVLGTANLVIGYTEINAASKENAVEEKLWAMGKELGWETLQLMADIACPFGMSDFINAYNGKGWISGKELSTWDRGVSALFGTYSLAADTLATLGGGVTAEVGGAGGVAIYGSANTLEALLRAGGKSPELIATARKLLPELMLLSKEAGGWEKLLPILLNLKKYSGYGVNAYMAGTVAVAGYSAMKIYYSTEGQEEIPFDFGEDGEGVNADEQIEAPIKKETKKS